MKRGAAVVQVPGETVSDDVEGRYDLPAPDDDAAVEAGQQGRARRIPKPRVTVAPAVLTVADDTRGDDAAINAKRTMSSAEAVEADRAGRLQRPVLTDAGWYVPRNSHTERMARRKQGERDLVDIE